MHKGGARPVAAGAATGRLVRVASGRGGSGDGGGVAADRLEPQPHASQAVLDRADGLGPDAGDGVEVALGPLREVADGGDALLLQPREGASGEVAQVGEGAGLVGGELRVGGRAPWRCRDRRRNRDRNRSRCRRQCRDDAQRAARRWFLRRSARVIRITASMRRVLEIDEIYNNIKNNKIQVFG